MSEKKVLVAVDGSKHSKKAFDYILEDAKKRGYHLTILEVVPGLGYAGEEVVEALDDDINEAEETVEKLKNEAEKQGVSADSEVITGQNIHTKIVKFAKDGDHDLIVIGGKGKSDLGTIHLGSVSEGVVKRAECSVLVVH